MILRWSRVERAGYEIERRANLQGDFERVAIIAFEDVVGGDTARFVDGGLEPATFYGYRVKSVGSLGTMSGPSEVVGARTAPPAGLDVFVTTNNASTPAGVYTVRASGSTGEFSGPVPYTGRSSLSPLPRGPYDVWLDGLALGCFVSGPTPKRADVTDQGLATRDTVSFIVNCRDPTKGEIHVDVLTLGAVAQAESYLLRLTGMVDGAPVSDTLPVQPALPGPASGRFVNLLPGSYDVSISRVDGTLCTVETDPIVESIEVQALAVDSVGFTLYCEQALEGHPIDGVWLQNGSPVTTVLPGQNVTLRIVASIPDTADLSTIQGQLTWDPTLLTGTAARDYVAGSEDIVDQFTGNLESGRLRFINLSITPDTANGLQGLVEVDFQTLREGLVIAPLQVVVAEDQFGTPVDVAPRIPRLAVQPGSGTVAPIARPGGPYQAQVGSPVTLNGSTSSDPDGGSITKYVWRFGDGTADSISGATPQHSYANDGTFTVSLEVVDDEDERGSASAQVTVADTASGGGGGGGPQAPPGNVLGIWTNTSGEWIETASVGQTVYLQICTTRPDVVGYQGQLSNIPGAVASVSGPVTELNSVSEGAGPCASSGPDIVDQFTFNPGSAVFDHLNVSIASAPGSGPQGLARVPFTINGTGTLQPTLTVPVLDGFGFSTITPEVGIQVLTIGGGGGGGTPPAGTPVARAGGPYAGVVGEALDVDGSTSSADASTSIVRHVWSFGDGTPVDSISGATASHTYGAPGSYDVVLTVRDGAGRTDADTTLALIQNPVGTDFAWSQSFSVPRATAGDSVALTLRTRPGQDFRSVDARIAWGGASLLLTRVAPAPAFDFVFQADMLGPDSMRIAGTATSAIRGNVETTVATLVFRVSGAEGDTIVTRTGTVSIRDGSLRPIDVSALPRLEDTLPVLGPNLKPIARANGPYSGKVGELLGLSAAGSQDPDGSITSFAWSFGDGATATGPAPQHTYQAVDTFQVVLTVTDDDFGVSADTTAAFIRLTDPPVAMVNGPYGAEAGSPINFSAAGSNDPDGSIVSFAWDFGDGATATGPAPQHTYTMLGTFPVRLTVTDNAGARVTSTTTALSWEPPSYSIRSTWTVPSTGTPSGPLAAPSLTTGGGTAGPGDVVVLRLSSKPGLPFVSASGTVTAAPTVLRFDSVRAGAFLDASFQASSVGAGSVAFSGAASTPAPNPAAEVLLAQLFYTVVGLDGSSATTSVTGLELRDAANTPLDLTPLAQIEGVFVTSEGEYEAANVGPTASAGGPYAATTGVPLTFTGSGSDTDGVVRRFDWSFGDGASATNAGTSPSHTYAVAGSYTVVLTVIDDDGATAQATATVTVSGVTTNFPPTADAGGPYQGLAGAPIAFDGSGSADSDGSIVTYSWAFGDGGTATGVAPSHSYVGGGAYTVTLTVTDDDGAATTATAGVTVAQPNQPPTAVITGPSTGETGASLSFSGSSSSDSDGSIQSYAWSFGNGATATGASAQVTYATAGSYAVTLIATDDDGAADTASIIVDVTDPPSGGANVVGVWTDEAGSLITTAAAGATVYLQVCVTRGDVSAFQSNLTGYPGTLAGADVADFDAAATGVGVCANPSGLDILNQYTGNPHSAGASFNVVNVTLSTTPGSGPQGTARYRFTAVQAGTYALTLTVSVLDGFDFLPIAPVVSLPTLVVS
jgi:PKD repeat protein